MSIEKHSIPVNECVLAVQRCGVDTLVTVPDWVQLSFHAKLNEGVTSASGKPIAVINACNENQTVTVAAGLTIGGKRPLLMMQNQGFYNCINTVRAVCLDAHIPLVFMVGQFGREFNNMDAEPSQSGRSMVRIMEPMLDVMSIPHLRLDAPGDMKKMDEAYALALEKQTAVVLLVSAPLAW